MTTVNLSATAIATATATATATVIRPRIRKISISGYRAFPPYRPKSLEIDLGPDGKNLLLFGENGSGKSSLYRALRDLFDDSARSMNYADSRNIFRQEDDDSVAVELTSGTPSDFKWEIGEDHPKVTGGGSFRSFARSCLFLDYRDLLKTNYDHHSGSPNLFRLLVQGILQNLPAPQQTLSELFARMVASNPYRRTNRQVARAEAAAQALSSGLRDHLPEIVAEGNRLLGKLQINTVFHLTPEEIKFSSATRGFSGQAVPLTVEYSGSPITEPQHFLNEARLTAMALSIYLAGARITRSGRPGILVLDDVLIGLDLSNRIPLLQLLTEEFPDWQVILLTHDSTWFEMAVERLSADAWSFQRLHATREPGTGRERPLHVIETEYLVRADAFLQDGDFPAAGVYLRSKFESLLRTFAEEHRLQIPFKRELREITSEHLWPKAKAWAPRAGYAPMVSPALANEIEFCRRFILNPLCHEAHGRPNRSEVELALAALKQLETAMKSTTAWRTAWDQRHSRGQALPKHWNLALCEWLFAQNPQPPTNEIAIAVRDAFAVGLENYNQRHGASFTFTADAYLTRQIQWDAAKTAGLATGQAAFVTLIDSHSAWLLMDAPSDTDLAAVAIEQVKAVFDALRGTSTGTSIKCSLHRW